MKKTKKFYSINDLNLKSSNKGLDVDPHFKQLSKRTDLLEFFMIGIIIVLTICFITFVLDSNLFKTSAYNSLENKVDQLNEKLYTQKIEQLHLKNQILEKEINEGTNAPIVLNQKITDFS